MSQDVGLFVALLWTLYFAECLVPHPPGAWLFRGARLGRLRATPQADLELVDGQWRLSLLPALPFGRAFLVQGASLDTGEAGRRIDGLEGVTGGGLTWATAALFTLVLVVLPVFALSGRLAAAAVPLAIAGAAAWTTTFILYWRAHGVLAGGWPSWRSWLPLLVSPLALIRARFTLELDVLRDLHPAAVAAACATDEECAKAWRVLGFDEPERREAVAAVAATRGIDPWRAPVHEAAPGGVVAWCPRCGALYRSGAVICADCPDVALVGLDDQHARPCPGGDDGVSRSPGSTARP